MHTSWALKVGFGWVFVFVATTLAAISGKIFLNLPSWYYEALWFPVWIPILVATFFIGIHDRVYDKR